MIFVGSLRMFRDHNCRFVPGDCSNHFIPAANSAAQKSFIARLSKYVQIVKPIRGVADKTSRNYGVKGAGSVRPMTTGSVDL